MAWTLETVLLFTAIWIGIANIAAFTYDHKFKNRHPGEHQNPSENKLPSSRKNVVLKDVCPECGQPDKQHLETCSLRPKNAVTQIVQSQQVQRIETQKTVSIVHPCCGSRGVRHLKTCPTKQKEMKT